MGYIIIYITKDLFKWFYTTRRKYDENGIKNNKIKI